MARNDDIARIIIEPSVAREPRVRRVGSGGDAHWVKETPMELIWPNGDPVARDKEMLVERITEDEARAYAGLAGAEVRGERELLNEIERLRAELKDADDDFHALKAMFDKMRDDRDHWRSLADLAYESLFNPTRTIGEFLEPYERAVRDE